MSFVLPNPTTPQNGQPGDATPILQNEQAIAQAISNFDGSQINPGSITEGALTASIDPVTRGNETITNFVFSGCIWSAVTGLAGTMTGGTIYVKGFRTIITGVGSNTFAASSDTYVDIDNLGNIVYVAVSNNASSPSITANSLRVAIVVTSGSTITFINQGQTDTTLSGFAPVVSGVSYTVNDGAGNLIYPNDPGGKVLGYRQITSSGLGIAVDTAIAGLSSCPVIVPANRKIKITGYFPNGAGSTTGDELQMSIKNNTTIIQIGWAPVAPTTGGIGAITAQWFGIPSAGLNTFVMTYQRGAGSGTVAYIAAGNSPAFIKVELE